MVSVGVSSTRQAYYNRLLLSKTPGHSICPVCRLMCPESATPYPNKGTKRVFLMTIRDKKKSRSYNLGFALISPPKMDGSRRAAERRPRQQRRRQPPHGVWGFGA